MKTKVLIIGILLGIESLLSAQQKQDSTKVEVFEEPAKSSTFKKRERFQYFRWTMLEEKGMMKMTISPYNTYYYRGVSFIIGYEHKLTPSFSLGGEVKYSVPVFKRREGHDAFNSAVPTVYTRYYYLQKTHLKRKMSGNNLLSNYFELRADGYYTYNLDRVGIVHLLWGLQRRVGRYGYLDAGIGIAYSSNIPDGIFPRTRIAFGLGFSNKNVHLKKKR